MKNRLYYLAMALLFALSACTPAAPQPGDAPGGSTADVPAPPETTPTELILPSLSITLGQTPESLGIRLAEGGDVDTQVVAKGDPLAETRASGGGSALPAPDGNTTPDAYLQFNLDDNQLFSASPSTRIRVEVDYFDEGLDSFSLQYDGVSDPFSDGGRVIKTNTLTFKTAVFSLCDARFANLANGSDFRLADNGDGVEFIRAVRVIALPPASQQVLRVDDFGANPFDDLPDSEAIQRALDSTCSGDTVVFTSGVGNPDYKGYLIDQTLFLTGLSAKRDLTFTVSETGSHALLRATPDLKGFVVRLYSRSRVGDAGGIDNIDFGFIDIDGGRETRVCLGPDGSSDGKGDNYGSWLPECSGPGDPWCMPGNLGMDGAINPDDPNQDYVGRPSEWTTGVFVHDLVNSQAECGTALAFGSAGGRIENVTVDTAGDHVHAASCKLTDNDGDRGAWSDGITLYGPGHTVVNNTVINPSDIGIVFFGGRGTVIANNTIRVTPGNYGAFGGIAIHPWIVSDIGGLEISNNTVISEGDTRCGGLHAGINLGPFMWGGACIKTARNTQLGNPGSCSLTPDSQAVTVCGSGDCQLWAFIPEGSTLTLRNNSVTGAHINYLVGGLAVFGTFIDDGNQSAAPQLSDWEAARRGCKGLTWGPLDRAAQSPSLPGYTELVVHCER